VAAFQVLEPGESLDDSFTYTISDGTGGTDTALVIVRVNGVNDAPVITTGDMESVDEDSFYSVHYAAVDMETDAASLVWQLDSDASWLHLEDNHLFGTPGNEDVGEYYVKITVTDEHEGSDYTNFSLIVDNVNDPPVITTVPEPMAREDTAYSQNFVAEDIDELYDFTWILVSEAGWLNINPVSGHISGTPGKEDVGAYLVLVTVYDGNGSMGDGSIGSDSIYYLLTVLPREPDPVIPPENIPPSIDPLSDMNATVGEVFYLLVTGSDPDEWDAVNLSYRLEIGPSDMIVSRDGILLWTPGEENLGNHTVMVVLSDGKNATGSSFVLSVYSGEEYDGGDGDVGDRAASSYAGNEIAFGLAAGCVIGLVVGMYYAYYMKKGTRFGREDGETESEEEEKSE
jgi:hypothetical protein